MTLENLINRLATGELYNHLWTDQTTRKIKPEWLDSLVSSINDGLTKIYTDLELKKDYLYLYFCKGKHEYIIDKKYNLDAFEYPSYNKYIMKRFGEPYRNDLIRINSVSYPSGSFYSINTSEHDSVHIQTFNRVIFSNISENSYAIINYVARHIELTSKDLDNIIEITPVLEAPLIHYVSSLVYSMTNSAESTAQSQKLISMYNAEIKDIISNGSVQPIVHDNTTKFVKGGWC